MTGALAAQAGRLLLQAAAQAAHGPEEGAHGAHDHGAHAAAEAALAASSAPAAAPPPPADAHEGHGHGAHSGGGDGQPTLDLRVAAIFSIFAGALLAGLLPIFVRRLASPDAPLARALRTFAGGTILGLALVHIIPVAIEELGALSVGYEHLGGVAVLLGVILLLIIDSTVTALMAPAAVKKALQAERAARSSAVAAAAAAGADADEREAASLPACAAGDPFHHHHVHTSPQAAALDAAAAAEAAAAAAEAKAAHGSHSHSHHHHNGDLENGAAAAAAKASSKKAAHHDDDDAPITLCHHNHGGGHGHGGHSHDHHHDHHDHDETTTADYHHASQHTHQCLRSSSAQRWQLAAAADGNTQTAHTANERAARAAALRKVKLTVGAYAMELGCIFHSIIIGIGLGVVVSGRAYVATLLGALTVHQALEGLSLGSVLARTGFSRLHQSAMVLTYSLTTPLGIAIGIAVTGAYDPASKTALAVQGALNGLSGGMLLHIALFQIVAEEFSREDLLARPRLRLGLYTSLLLGAALMCILAIWA